jgi:cyclopropane fatty-acyl-phospholipid synthase-like methyltransferase
VTDYDGIYRDGTAPWEIGIAQPALDLDLDGPRVLDIGCGSGEVALELARRGHQVTGVDISAVAVDQARAKAAAEGLIIDFRVGDARELSLEPFDAVVDSGLRHSLHRYGGVDDYLDLLPRLIVSGGSLTILAISAADGHGWGVTEDYLRGAFAAPAWADVTVTPIEVVSVTGALPGFLLRAVRGG